MIWRLRLPSAHSCCGLEQQWHSDLTESLSKDLATPRTMRDMMRDLVPDSTYPVLL